MKKFIAGSLLLPFVLVSCGAPADTAKTEEAKMPFYIETQKAKEFPKNYTVEKTGRLVGSSTISLASQGVGRVANIAVHEGSVIKKGQLLVSLTDTTANYDLKVSQAANGLASAKNSSESTKLSLDKAISDAKLALTKAQSDYTNAQEDAAKRLEKAKRDAAKSDLGASGSDANTTIEQLKANLSKAELDYENLKKSNAQTLINYNTSYQLSVSDLRKYLNKISYEGDKLFGITSRYPTDNGLARKYLGMGNSSIRPDLELAYYKIAGIASDFDAKANSTVNVDETNLIAQLDQLSSYYKDSKAYLAVVTRYLENSITSSEFPQSSVDGYINTYTGYKNEVASLEAGYVNFRNGAASFLATYRNNESSALAGLEVQRKQIEVQKNGLNTGEFEANLGLDRTKIEIEKTLSTYKNVVDNAQANYDNAVKNKDITLRKLEVTQTDAALSLQQAQEELSKLSILAPIDGTVTKVIASVGQDVNAGTPMVEIANKNPEVVFDVDFDTVGQLKIGATSPVLYEEKSYTGTVVGVSQVASDSLQYSVRVALSQSPALIGGIAKISLKLPSAMPILPTKMVKVLTEQTGEIQTFSGGVFVPKTVKLGRINGSMIEILTPVDQETEIVTSDIANFDARKFEPKKKDAAEVLK